MVCIFLNEYISKSVYSMSCLNAHGQMNYIVSDDNDISFMTYALLFIIFQLLYD